MATYSWKGRAKSVAMAGTITPTAVNSETYTIGIPDVTNGKTVAYTADASATVAEITAALYALLAASEEPEFLEITWADATTHLTWVSKTPGTPVTIASAATGVATLVTATTTANVSPNDINNANNWLSTAGAYAVPGNNDTAVFDDGDVDAMWNLSALAAVTGITVYRRKGYTGRIGLPTYNPTGYFEYRATELAFAGGTFFLELNASDQAEQLKFTCGATAGTFHINGEGSQTLGEEQVWIRGTGNNVINVTNGSAACAPVGALATTVTTLRATSSTVRTGQGCTVTTVSNYGSTIEINGSVTTLAHYGAASATYVKDAGVITNAPSLTDGTLFYMSSADLPGPTIGTDATVDFTQDTRARTVTGNVTIRKGGRWLDPYGTVSGVAFVSDAAIEEYELSLPAGKTVTIS